jgi:Arc/MetJ-type ribon-helix-helix transcriptional regulator
MNALDLADCLEALVKNNRDSFVKDAVLMLRSQEGIIEALSNRIDMLENMNARLKEIIEKSIDMNNVLGKM